MDTTKDAVFRALRTANYPGFSRDVVSFGLVHVGVDKDATVLHQVGQLLAYLLQYDAKSATAVFATTADFQNALIILTKHSEVIEHEKRNNIGYPYDFTHAATPAYL